MKLEFDSSVIRPLVQQVVAEAISRLEESGRQHGSQLAYTEAQAAAMLGVKPHVLRDLRLSGEVEASRVGMRIVYTRESLTRLLEKNKWTQ